MYSHLRTVSVRCWTTRLPLNTVQITRRVFAITEKALRFPFGDCPRCQSGPNMNSNGLKRYANCAVQRPSTAGLVRPMPLHTGLFPCAFMFMNIIHLSLYSMYNILVNFKYFPILHLLVSPLWFSTLQLGLVKLSLITTMINDQK